MAESDGFAERGLFRVRCTNPGCGWRWTGGGVVGWRGSLQIYCASTCWFVLAAPFRLLYLTLWRRTVDADYVNHVTPAD